MTSVAPKAPNPDARGAAAGSPPTWSELHCGGAWIVQRYDDVAQALRDPRFCVARAGRWVNSSVAASAADPRQRLQDRHGLREFKRLLSRSLLFIDGRAHRRLRRVMAAGFHAQALQDRAPAIDGIVRALLSNIMSRAQRDDTGRRRVDFDFIRDIARPLPALVIADLMGVATDRQPGFMTAASAIAAFIGAPTPSAAQAFAAQDALLDMRDHFSDMLAAPARLPPESLTALLLRQQCEGRLSALETLAQCCTLLFAGYETTRHLLGNGMLALLRHPSQRRALQNAPEGLPLALREMLRYDSPIRYTGRRLREDVLLHGQAMRKGQLVILDIACANRDPAQFSEPGELRLDRDEGNHLAFGRGPHVCIGAALTYMEAEIAFRAVDQCMPDLSLAHGAAHRPGARSMEGAYHGLDALEVACSWPHHPRPVEAS